MSIKVTKTLTFKFEACISSSSNWSGSLTATHLNPHHEDTHPPTLILRLYWGNNEHPNHEVEIPVEEVMELLQPSDGGSLTQIVCSLIAS